MTCARAALPALRVPRLAPRPARPSRGALVARRASGESSSTSSSSVDTDPAAARARLEAAMADAVAAEDFTLAARLRDDLAAVNAADELYVATRALELAVLEERYDDAARLRDRVAELTPPPPPKVPTQSDVVTRGIRVVVLSQYVPSRSDPERSQYFFAYSVRVTNDSTDVVQLRDRRWEITDAVGGVETVEGPGVVGQQPVLLPGQTFEYASACPLNTPRGSIRGCYTFVRMMTQSAEEYRDDDEGAAEAPDEDIPGAKVTFIREGERAEFEVEVGEFGLDAEPDA